MAQSHRSLRSLLPGLLACGLALAPLAAAGVEPVELPSAEEIEAAVDIGASLTGREIWDRFLANRFRTARARLRIVSSDPGGAAQETVLDVRWKDYRKDGEVRDGVLARTFVRFEAPFDVRALRYLGLTRDGAPDEHFIYRQRTNLIDEGAAGARRVRRLRLDGIGLLGTDYTWDDIAFHTTGDAEYERLPDDVVQGVPVYAVRARLHDELSTRYPITTAWVAKDTYTLIRQVFADANGTPLRELRANVETIEEFPGGFWVATQSVMHDLKQGTQSQLTVESVEANPELPDRLFSQTELLRFAR